MPTHAHSCTHANPFHPSLPLSATADTTLSLHPTKLQLLGSSLGLEFDSLNYDLFLTDEVNERLAVTPFTRMVIIFNYEGNHLSYLNNTNTLS